MKEKLVQGRKMECKIIKSVQGIPLINTNRMSGFNCVLGHLQTWERSFGLNCSVSFDQEIRFSNDIIYRQLFYHINKFAEQGYIEIDNSYAHIRPEFVTDDEQWRKIDARVQRLVKKGKINLIPYKGSPYRLYEG